MILSYNYATVLPEPSLTKKKNIYRLVSYNVFNGNILNIIIEIFIDMIGIYTYHNHCTRIRVRSFSSLQEQMYLVPTRHRGQVFSYHKHIPTFWNWFVEINFYIKKKITAFQTLYWSNIHVFLCLFILKTSFKNYSFLLLFLRDPLEHMRHFVWQF